MIKVSLVFLISNIFNNKIYQANKLSAKKIPSWANPALISNEKRPRNFWKKLGNSDYSALSAK